MTNLIRGLRDLSFFKAKEERIILFGNDAVGKTTLLYRLKLQELVTTIATIGFNVETIEHQKKRYTLWDVGGCDKIRPLWRHYVAKDSSLLYIHNPMDDRVDESLEGVRVAAEMMLEVSAKFIFVIFSKQDLLPIENREAILEDHRAMFERELQPYKERIGCKIVDLPGFSAVTGDQCSELLEIFDETFQHAAKQSKPAAAKSTESPQPLKADASAPTNADLVARIQREQSSDLESEEFWKAFVSAEISEWNHRCHLRAGYVLLLDSLRAGRGIFECAKTFLEHLQRLKDAKPDRFRNTEHRTMTIFWLWHLQLAVMQFKEEKSLEKWPGHDVFHDVLLNSPRLMYGGLWKEYYTKDLMMSPESKEYWRLPDLQALPDFNSKIRAQAKHARRPSQEISFRLMKFAFAVVQKYMSTDIRRGWLVKQCLAALQTATMRLRAQNPIVPPYSETQAYFWIQMVHAALASAWPGDKKASIAIPIGRLSFASFRVLFDMDPMLWQKYYSPGLWEGMEARVAFVLPDKQPLPDVVGIPSAQHVFLALDKQVDSARIGMAAEIPSMEELALSSIVLLDEVESMSAEQRASPNINSHAHMIAYLFDRLATAQLKDPSKLASEASSVLMEMSGTYLKSLTLKAFWVQQMLGACSQMKEKVTFQNFVRANLHLLYPALPECYFSESLLFSLDAKDTIVQPDLRKLNGFFPVAGAPKEDDWILV